MHCVSEPFTVGLFLVERNAINESPPYQREAAVWGPEKQQLLLDSLFNDFDIPKIYLHDLRGKDPRYKFAIVDGKQRLDTVWKFLDGVIKLADDFRPSETEGRPALQPGSRFGDLHPDWQELFKAKRLDVVLVQNAEEEDIEELFSRLNNGEPLNAAEKRNAMGGDMCALIRDIARAPFFRDRLPFQNTRYQWYEISAKFLLLEKTELDGAGIFCDLKKRFLDKMVSDHRNMTVTLTNGLRNRVEAHMRLMSRVFTRSDPVLRKQAYAPLYRYTTLKACEVVGTLLHQAIEVNKYYFGASFSNGIRTLSCGTRHEASPTKNVSPFGYSAVSNVRCAKSCCGISTTCMQTISCSGPTGDRLTSRMVAPSA